jgi:hypothetical protein
LDLSGSGHGRRNEGKTQKSKQRVFHMVLWVVKYERISPAQAAAVGLTPQEGVAESNRPNP